MKICPACSREYPSERSHCERDGVMLVALATGAGARAEDLIGRVVDGRYQIEAIIGKGGMGTVYACRHVVVGKPFAMKVLRQGVEQTGDVLQRFIREAQTANSVRSRHIVEMTDFGQLQSGQFYVTMELLEGMDLGKALKRGLGREQLVHVFIQCADVLELTHQRGIVHRDLKPDNIFLVNEEGDPLFVKLLDFGIAKALHAGPSGLTETGVVLGTPYYMSPEQARGEEVDSRTDIYSLGVIMYRAFTGKLPFIADSAVGVLTRHLTEAPEAPSRVSGVDPAIERVILCCLEKRRNDRFPSMKALGDALRALSAGPQAVPGAPQAGSRPATLQGVGPGAAHAPMPSGAYAAAPPSVHNPGAPMPSGAYSAAAPSGPYAAARPGASGPYSAVAQPAASGSFPAAPAPSGPYAAAQPMPSGPYAAAQPMPSGPYAAAQPMPSGPYAAAQPMPSGPYAAAQPVPSGPYAAAPTGSHAAAPAPSGAYTTTRAGVHPPPSAGAPPSMGAPPSIGGPSSMSTPAAEWTSHGLATSQAMRVPPPTRRWPLLVGAIAMVGIGGVIAVTLGALGRSKEPDAAGPGDAATTAAATTAAAPTTAAATTATSATDAPTAAPTATAAASDAPAASASAAPAPSASAAPASSATAAPSPKPSGKVPAAASSSSKTQPPSTKRAPEIRSPFD